MAVIELNEGNFSSKIQKGVILVDFYAQWCGPCRMMAPILEKIASTIGDKATIAKLDIDKEQNLAAKFQIASIPTLILFKDGKEIKRESGLQDETAISNLISAAQ